MSSSAGCAPDVRLEGAILLCSSLVSPGSHWQACSHPCTPLAFLPQALRRIPNGPAHTALRLRWLAVADALELDGLRGECIAGLAQQLLLHSAADRFVESSSAALAGLSPRSLLPLMAAQCKALGRLAEGTTATWRELVAAAVADAAAIAGWAFQEP